jgi:hypothetical protein
MKTNARKKIEIIILAAVLVFLAAVIGINLSEKVRPMTMEEYYNSLDQSCGSDSDCEIKDVHNCCGYYPRCVNKNAKTDVALVESICKNQGIASVCGFPSIDYCACEKNLCIGKYRE